jgi:hypothetical protein
MQLLCVLRKKRIEKTMTLIIDCGVFSFKYHKNIVTLNHSRDKVVCLKEIMDISQIIKHMGYRMTG